jgi:hypothetical protein
MTARPDSRPPAPSGPSGAQSGVFPDVSPEVSSLEAEITPILAQINGIASAHGDDPQVLLALLRHLEHLHRSIQEGPFRSSLPSERSTLFKLLQDMELSGGWPYIPRLQLRTFLDLLQQTEPEPEQPQANGDLAQAA